MLQWTMIFFSLHQDIATLSIIYQRLYLLEWLALCFLKWKVKGLYLNKFPLFAFCVHILVTLSRGILPSPQCPYLALASKQQPKDVNLKNRQINQLRRNAWPEGGRCCLSARPLLYIWLDKKPHGISLKKGIMEQMATPLLSKLVLARQTMLQV